MIWSSSIHFMFIIIFLLNVQRLSRLIMIFLKMTEYFTFLNLFNIFFSAFYLLSLQLPVFSFFMVIQTLFTRIYLKTNFTNAFLLVFSWSSYCLFRYSIMLCFNMNIKSLFILEGFSTFIKSTFSSLH